MNTLVDNGLIALLCLGLGLFQLWHGWQAMQRAKASATWPQAPGEIISSTVQARDNGEDTFRRTVISYRYAVAGTTYQATRVFYGDDIALQFTGPGKDRLRRYPLGQQVQVAYDPATPQEAVLEPGLNQATSLSLAVPLALILFGTLNLLGGLAN